MKKVVSLFLPLGICERIIIENTPETGIDYPSKLQFNYPLTIDKELRLIEKLGIANKKIMEKAKKA